MSEGQDEDQKQAMPKSLRTAWDFLFEITKTQGVAAALLIYVICVSQPANQKRQCEAYESCTAKHAQAVSEIVTAFREEQTKCDERNQELMREVFRNRGFAGEWAPAGDLP